MDIRKKLNEIQNVLSNDQEEERNIVNDLMFLMFGRDSEELPKEFEVECIMDNEQVRKAKISCKTQLKSRRKYKLNLCFLLLLYVKITILYAYF